MFWSKINKNRYTPAYPSFVVYVCHGHVFLMNTVNYSKHLEDKNYLGHKSKRICIEVRLPG